MRASGPPTIGSPSGRGASVNTTSRCHSPPSCSRRCHILRRAAGGPAHQIAPGYHRGGGHECRTLIGGCDDPEEGLGRAIHPSLLDFELGSTPTVTRSGQPVFVTATEGRCWAVTSGYVKLLDPHQWQPNHPADPRPGWTVRRSAVRQEGILADWPRRSRSRPSSTVPPKSSRWTPGELEAAIPRTPTSLPCCSSRSRRPEHILERRLLWQFTTPLRAPS